MTWHSSVSRTPSGFQRDGVVSGLGDAGVFTLTTQVASDNVRLQHGVLENEVIPECNVFIKFDHKM